MIPVAADQLILVSIDDAAAARIMRGVLHSARDSRGFFFLLAHEGLLDVLGAGPHLHGVDAEACMLNPERFCLVITFGSLIAGGVGTARSWLVSYFDEIGIPTLEIQRHLFQEGYALGAQPEPSGIRHLSGGGAVLWRYAARHLIGWGGATGIGYPRAHVGEYELPVRPNLVCVTSSLEHVGCSEQDRYKFTIAVLKVAMAHPELALCWVVRSEELLSELAAPMLKMIVDAALPNLWLETSESPQTVIRRSQFGIAMPSTALLDYQDEDRPVLLFAGPLHDALGEASSRVPFANYFELESQLQTILAQPADHVLRLAVPAFDQDKLNEHIRTAMAQARLSPHWFQVLPKYLGQLQAMALVERPAPKRDQADLPAIDKLAAKLTTVIERLGVIQRSTVGYKALKLANLLKGGRRSPRA